MTPALWGVLLLRFCPTSPARLSAKCLWTALRGAAESNAPAPGELPPTALPMGQGRPAISFVKTFYLTEIKASFKNSEDLPQLLNSHCVRMCFAFEMFALIFSKLVPKSKLQGRLPGREERSRSHCCCVRSQDQNLAACPHIGRGRRVPAAARPHGQHRPILGAFLRVGEQGLEKKHQEGGDLFLFWCTVLRGFFIRYIGLSLFFFFLCVWLNQVHYLFFLMQSPSGT